MSACILLYTSSTAMCAGTGSRQEDFVQKVAPISRQYQVLTVFSDWLSC